MGIREKYTQKKKFRVTRNSTGTKKVIAQLSLLNQEMNIKV